MPHPTISSEEFQQKLQAGQINEALALVLDQASTLDVTTQITDDIRSNLSDSHPQTSEYLRTKINLLTGEIQNEVGRDLITNSISYLKLQQLHIDRIVTSHRLVQSYLQQIQGVLTAIESTSTIASGLESPLADEKFLDRSNIADALPTRLAEAFRSILNSNSSDLSENSDSLPSKLAASDSIDLPQTNRTEPIAEDMQTFKLPQPSPPSSVPILSPVAFDDGIDLAIDENTVVWEEWVEEDPESAPKILRDPTPADQSVTIPDWGEDWDRRQLNPITVKPISRIPAAAKTVDPLEQWDQFLPEHVGIYIDPKPNSPNSNDPHQIDRLLADLDKISKGQEIK
jgi:hypothetical protein